MKSYKIGLDFGTTNSILSYINDSGNLETFRYPSVSGADYIPSCVSYDKNKDFIRIGRDAFRIAGDQSTEFYKDMKMMLPQPEKEYKKLGWNEKKSPEEVITDYLKKLLISDKRNDYSFKKEIGHIDGIVLSVPQAWLTRQANHQGRPKLEKILKENLKLPLIQLISEPVAAAAYYSNWHKEEYNDFFDGNLLVCDMGGGTFDVTLCKLSKNKVEVIMNDGNGLFEIGKAGVYFDTEILKLAYKRIDSSNPLKEGTPIFYEFYKQLQEYKVDCSQQITDNIQTALSHPLYSKKLPIIENPLVCYMSDVETAFSEVKKGMENVLESFLNLHKGEKTQIDRVIFVGGFNEFELTKNTIKDYLNKHIDKISGEMKFIEEITSRMSAKAISYGATLIANDIVKVQEIYPHTIGIVLEWREVKDNKKEIKLINQKQYIPIIKARDKLINYKKTTYHDQYLLSFEAHPKLTLYIKPHLSNKTAEKEIPKGLDIELPNFNKNNRWKVGMRLDESQIAYIVFIDEEKNIESKPYELGNILTEMFGLNGLIISKE